MRKKKGPKFFKALKKSHVVFLLTGKKENYEGQVLYSILTISISGVDLELYECIYK